MKKLLLAFCLFCSLAFAVPLQDRRIDRTALSELASKLGISAEDNLIEKTQAEWRRKQGQERWEMAELSAEQKQFVLDWGKSQGLFNAWKPSCKEYDKALILGATTFVMQKRLDFLKECWNEGVRFREIVWLTGDRPLDKRVDGLTERCSNESEAARIIWQEANLPEEMRQLSVLFVAVPMEDQKRPNTEDTIHAWLKVAPEPCKALFVSDQPFCGYQFAVLKSVLPESFQFELVGQGRDPASHPAAAAITLDSIARWIYQEEQYF